MANTSFVGPVRSKNNYKLYSTTASTGVEHDRTMGDPAKDARRYYLEEWFKKKPGLNAVSIIDGNKIEKIEKNLKSFVANKIAKKIINHFVQ